MNRKLLVAIFIVGVVASFATTEVIFQHLGLGSFIPIEKALMLMRIFVPTFIFGIVLWVYSRWQYYSDLPSNKKRS